MEDHSASEIREMFDGIAARYDLLNDLLSLGLQRFWRGRAIKRLREDHLNDVLDLACGTGDFTLALLRRVRVDRMVCADLSRGMLDVARRKFSKLGLADRVEIVECAAEQLPFPDGSFDAVLIGYGVRNFSVLAQALQECARVLKPGGRVLVLEFTMPRAKLFAWFYRLYLGSVVLLLGGLVGGSFKSYRYLHRSIEHFSKSDWLSQCIASAGLEVSMSYRQAFGIVTAQYLSRRGENAGVS